MIELPYSLIIEATDEPDFFDFYSPDLEGFTGVGHSAEDRLYQAKWGMVEFLEIMAERKMAIPPRNHDPTILIKNAEREAANRAVLAPQGPRLAHPEQAADFAKEVVEVQPDAQWWSPAPRLAHIASQGGLA
jgi:hypothetical protein